MSGVPVQRESNMKVIFCNVCVWFIWYELLQSWPAFPVLLSTVLGAAITVPGQATAFGLDWIYIMVALW